MQVQQVSHLKGSYPNVDNEEDRKYYEENPKSFMVG